MKLKPITLVLVGVAVLFGSTVFVLETRRDSSPTDTAESAAQPIFGFKEDQVQAFTVNTPKQTLKFERAAAIAKPGQPKWLMTAPERAPASDASVAYLLNLLATGKSDRTLKVAAQQQSEFGFEAPTATVEVKLADQKTHQLILGKQNFNRSFLYAQADPTAKAPEINVLLVSTDFENAVTRPLSEWKDAGQPQGKPAP